jgi:8-amino-7-oxononanoate synthase
MDLHSSIQEYTNQLAQKGLIRMRSPRVSDSFGLIHFDSNDYLSLSDDKQLADAYCDGYRHYPSGSGASMMLSGYHSIHEELERAFAEQLEVDECVIVSSGYAANLAVTALLGAIKAHCYIDKSLHASLYDGFSLSNVHYTRYKHNDLFDLSAKLHKASAHSAVLTEGIFSMSGQIADLMEISSLCGKSNIPLIVDEAHSFGVLGVHGKGLVSACNLSQKEIPLRIIPLGKACAGQGALIAGQSDWIRGVLQAARSIIYSTAISPAQCYGLLKTLNIVLNSDDKRRYLQNLVDFFKEQIQGSSLDWATSSTPIQQVRLGCPHKAMHYAQELRKRGFSCSAIRAPTVPPMYTGLRVVLNYRHSQEQIQELFYHMHQIYESSF